MRRSTPPGQHRPVLLQEVLRLLDPRPGQIAVDCTVGYGGHAAAILQRLGPCGRLIGLDCDADHLPQARGRLQEVRHPFSLHHANFAGLQNILAAEGIEAVDMILADLGMSSMQVDDPERGFSYVRDGPLDMRMDRSRGKTAAKVLATISEADLHTALTELGDEPQAATIARAIVAARQLAPLERTGQLSGLIMDALGQPRRQLRPRRNQWQSHPAVRAFQMLRLLVNRELSNLESLVRAVPACLRGGGIVALISFHSGEDRRVKAALREGCDRGVYSQRSPAPIRSAWAERQANPRSRSAKMRWAKRADYSTVLVDES